MKKITQKIGAFAFAVSMMFAGSAFAADVPELLNPATAMNDTEWNAMVATNEERMATYENYVSQYGESNIPSVYFDGEKVGFTDAFAVIKDGTTFMPISAFVTATGAVIDYEDATQKVTVYRDGGDISFVIGSDEVMVGDEVITLTAATFEQNSRAYVPVRVLSEAFGYEVMWQEYTCEVNVLDSAALLAQFESGYTVLDSILAMSSAMDLDANYGFTGSFDVNYTSDDKVVVSNTTMEGVANMDVQNYEMNTVIDFGDYDEEIKAMLAQAGEDASMAAEFLTLVKDLQVDFILDGATFDMYIKTNISGFVGKYIMGIDEWTNDTWIKITYADLMTEEQYAEMLEMVEGMKAGTLEMNTAYLAESMLNSYKEIPMSYFNYVGIIETAFEAVADDKFVEDEGVYAMVGSGEGYEFTFVVTVVDGVAQDYTFDAAAEFMGVAIACAGTQDIYGTGEFTFNVDYYAVGYEYEYDGEVYSTPEQNLNIDMLFETFMTNEGVPATIPTENVYELPVGFGAMSEY